MLTNVFLVRTPFIHSLNKYLLNVYFVPKSPAAGDKTKNETGFVIKKVTKYQGT